VLARADAPVLERAAQSTLGLTPVSACSALAVGEGAGQLVDPAVAEALAQAQALRGTGQWDPAEEAAQSALREARSADHARAIAEALEELGEIALARQDAKLAEDRYVDVLAAAQRAELPSLVGHAELRLGWATGALQSRPVDAERWFRLAESAIDRLGDEADPDRALLLTGRAYTRRHAGHSHEGAEDSRAAIRLLEERLPGDWRSLASARNVLGTSLDEIDETEEAERTLTLSLQGFEHGLGPLHPTIAAVLNNLGRVQMDLGKYEEARASEERGIAIGASSGVPGHVVARAWLQLSDALSRQGRFDEARAALERAFAVARSTPTTEPRFLAGLYGQQGCNERLEGRYDEALGHLQIALDMMDRSLGPHHPESVGPVCDIGLLYLARGQVPAALPRLEEALSLAEGRSDCVPLKLGLAQALWQTGRDRPRARALVREEREYFRTHPARAGEVRDIELWFEKHAPEIADAN
jgi:tetratricopeptide (TPR) repeat protein